MGLVKEKNYVIIGEGMKLIVLNKKALFNYFVLSKSEAGIVLKGSEVKAIRENGLSLAESFIIIRNNEIILKNAYIKQYSKATAYAPDPRQDRKLLLHKEEIRKLRDKVLQEGFTLMPIKAYFVDSLVKIEVGLCKGKKLYDKKEVLKEKDISKDTLRQLKQF